VQHINMAATKGQASGGSGRKQGKKKNLNLSLNTDTAKVGFEHCKQYTSDLEPG